MGEPTLDCQDCGRVLLRLNPTQAAKVAERPYDYVRYCRAGTGCRIEVKEPTP